MNQLRATGSLIKPEEKMDKELVKLEVLHHQEIESKQVDADIENQKWKSCCFQLEPESTRFFGKLCISLITISLCSFQLITNVDSCSTQIAYSSLLSMVVGSYLRV